MLKLSLFKLYLSSMWVLLISISVVAEEGDEIGRELQDLNYGAIIYEFYQQNYFAALIEYAYADEKGGVENHGNYPELLKGGISFSYGLEQQAKNIFDKALAGNLSEKPRNRVWFYVAKMAYQRGDIESSAKALANIHGKVKLSLQAEYLYLSSIVKVQSGSYLDVVSEIDPESIDNDERYLPYIIFNLAVANLQLGNIDEAVREFKKLVGFGSSLEHKAIADRANLALMYLLKKDGDDKGSSKSLQKVHSSGLFSNRALLTYSWLAINNGDYKRSLTSLAALKKRSIAIPEVQEAILLIPHVYERLKLKGRAQQGFIVAGKQYQLGLQDISTLRQKLQSSEYLRKFALKASVNPQFRRIDSDISLSPYLLNLMADQTFQTVLNEMQGLLELKRSLTDILKKEEGLKVILDARGVSRSKRGHNAMLERLRKRYKGLVEKKNAIDEKVDVIASQYGQEDKARIQSSIDFIDKEMAAVSQTLDVVSSSKKHKNSVSYYKKLIKKRMVAASRELRKTERMLKKVDKVMFKLVSNELDMHQERFKYYLVQARLAKARLYDSVLLDIDPFDEQGVSTPVAL